MSVYEDLAAAAAESGRSATAAKDRVAAAIGAERAASAQARQDLADYIAAHPDQTEGLTVILNEFVAADAIVDSIEAAEAPPPAEPPVEPPPVEPIP